MPIKRIIHTPNRQPIKIWTAEVEDKARQQLENIATLPFIHKHIAVMPDVHLGKGATVGSVIPTIGAIIPAAVGVDLGCGMMAAKLNLRADQLPDNLAAMRSAIEAAVPHGRTDNGGKNDRGAWDEVPDEIAGFWQSLKADPRLEIAHDFHPKLLTGNVNTARHLGTLGTGNHFIEVCLDEHQDVWLMLHSGSRGIGNRIGSYFIELAKEDMRKWFINLPDADLAYLPEGTDHFRHYVAAVSWAQDFAKVNRQLMFHNAMRAIANTLRAGPIHWEDVAINCHHNYVEKEHHFGSNVWVTRKGAIRAREGDLGIIPGSMGQRSYIVRGKGNPDSFHSCSHGAGRKMSRGEAERTFTVADLEQQTTGVECRKDAGVLDEIPGAYKNIDQVIADQTPDLIEVVHTLKQVLCVKG